MESDQTFHALATLVELKDGTLAISRGLSDANGTIRIQRLIVKDNNRIGFVGPDAEEISVDELRSE